MLGPLEAVIIEFEGNRFRGEITPILQEIVDQGIIRIIDLTFIKKDDSGKVEVFELSELDPEEAAVFGPAIKDFQELFSEEDVVAVGETIANNTSVALLLFEHAWATKLKEAILGANGRLILDERIPPEVVSELIGEITASTI